MIGQTTLAEPSDHPEKTLSSNDDALRAKSDHARQSFATHRLLGLALTGCMLHVNASDVPIQYFLVSTSKSDPNSHC